MKKGLLSVLITVCTTILYGCSSNVNNEAIRDSLAVEKAADSLDRVIKADTGL